ncbi:MAG: antibiotic biosynthesis monooxygenase, partial [Bacteroidia bacterium]|nr:antibiotic biosynthesis monooxygenase [Bacteroidia bacterium]
MIVRIVRMEFQKDKIEEFKKLFRERKEKIRSFPGCKYLELLQGLNSMDNVFITYSYW